MTDAMPGVLKYNDKQHAYWLDGRRTKGVTTVAKIPDNTFAIAKWRDRMLVTGMAMSPPLIERAAAHYDERDVLEDIAEEALVAAKAHEAAGRGSAAHRITERHDLDEMVIDTPYARQVLEAWTKALDDAGLVMLPEYIERVVCYPDIPLAGTFDRIARRKFDGSLVIVDLKTGANAVKYPHSTAIQLALYANAPILAGVIPPGGGETREFESMPAVSKTVGYVIHMPNDATTVEVRPMNIAAGWEAAQKIVFPTLEWRDRSDLVGDALSAASLSPLIDNIRARLGVLKMLEDADKARALVAARWPKDTPAKPPWTEAQGSAIVAVLTRVELELGVPF